MRGQRAYGAARALTMLAAILCVNQLGAQESSRQPSASDQVGTGTIEGIVIYETDRRRRWRFRRNYVADRKAGHLAGAVVCLDDSAKTDPGEPSEWTIDQLEYRFIPETLAIRAGDRVRFTNSDPLLHDVTTHQKALDPESPQQVDSFSLGKREEVERVFRDAGGNRRPIALSCRFHGAMRAWILVFDHPYFHVTARDGKFQLTQVPAGRHAMVMVHPAGRLRWEQAITVRAGETARIEIRVSPDHLVPKDESRSN